LSPLPQLHPLRLLPGLQLVWLTDDIAIGGTQRRIAWHTCARAGIDTVLDLRDDAKNDATLLSKLGIEYARVPIPEGEAPTLEQLQIMAAWIGSKLRQNRKALIHCAHGMGRSATVACATLVALGFSLPHAYDFLPRAEPRTALSQQQARTLESFANKARLEKAA